MSCVFSFLKTLHRYSILTILVLLSIVTTFVTGSFFEVPFIEYFLPFYRRPSNSTNPRSAAICAAPLALSTYPGITFGMVSLRGMPTSSAHILSDLTLPSLFEPESFNLCSHSPLFKGLVTF